MNRYSHCDFYPDFHVNFIKKGSVNDVPPVTLKDMGFSEDTDYRDQTLEELPKDRREAIIAEFIFLIDRVLPRNIQDLFYRIALDPRRAYWRAFDEASNRMQLVRYTDHKENNYGQFVDHVQLGILDMIEEGMSLLDIYDSTCVTKKMLTETADGGFVGPELNQNYDRWKLVPMEIALMGVSDITYSLNERKADLLVKQGDKDVLAILTVKKAYYVSTPYSVEIEDDFFDIEYDEEMYRDGIDQIKSEYEKRNVPVLLIDSEYYEWEESYLLRKVIKNAIGNMEFAIKHNEERKQYYIDLLDEEDDCFSEEEKLFEKLVKKGYENLTDEEKDLYQQLEVMMDAEDGYDYYEDEQEDGDV